MIELRHNTATREDEEQILGLSAVRTPGQHLQDERNNRGLSVSEVAEKLKVSGAYIQALESDRYDRLPGEAFVVGYLRSYARLLEIPADSLLHSYRVYRRQLESARQPQLQQAPAERSAPHWQSMLLECSRALRTRPWMAPAALAALVLLLGFFLFSGGGESEQEMLESPEAPAQQPVPPIQHTPTEPVEDTPVPADSEDEQYDMPEEAESFSREPQLAAGDATRRPQAAASLPGYRQAPPMPVVNGSYTGVGATLDSLALEFVEECWVEVTDARGDVLATDLYQKGESVQLQGEAPFAVVLGNVHAARVRLNDAAVTLVARADRDSLKTTIGP